MRLTNTMKEAFVRAAMQDVPSIDYKEQARSLANKMVAAKQKELGLHKIDADRLDYRSCSFYDDQRNYVLDVAARGLNKNERSPIESDAGIQELLAKHRIQEQQHTELKTKLTSAINACNTRKQAAEALPEFEKYLPEDEPKALRSLPALANVAAEFVKAGWPKPAKASSKQLQAA